MNLINKIIDWFDSEDSKESEKPSKTISLKQLIKIPEKIFEFNYDVKKIKFNPFLIFDKVTELGYLGGGIVNGIVNPPNGINRIELSHNGIGGLEIPKHRCIEKKTNVYVYEVETNRKLEIINMYEIDCVYFDTPIYPGSSTSIRVYDRNNEKYKNVELISTCCSVSNTYKLLNEYRIWEQRKFEVATRPDTSSGTCFEKDRLIITEIKLFSTQYKSKPINLKPIKRLFQKRYKNKRKILSKYLCKNVIGIICSY